MKFQGGRKRTRLGVDTRQDLERETVNRCSNTQEWEEHTVKRDDSIRASEREKGPTEFTEWWGGDNRVGWKEREKGRRRKTGTRRHLTCLRTRQSSLRARSSAGSTSGYFIATVQTRSFLRAQFFFFFTILSLPRASASILS